jgi:hypothetical protein
VAMTTMNHPVLQLARLKTEGEPYFEQEADEIALGYTITRASIERQVWQMAAPHAWIPKPLVELVAAAAALVIVKNPLVTRRFWAGWGMSAKV